MLLTKVKHVISDQDGTTSAFASFMGPAFLEIVPHFASVLRISSDEFIAGIGANFKNARTHETPFPFVGPFFASHWKGSHRKFVEKVTKPYFEMVDANREKFLVPFPGVRKVLLEEAPHLGVDFSILSDAPLYCTLQKLKTLKLQEAFVGVYARDIRRPHQDEVWNSLDYQFCRERLSQLMGLSREFPSAKVVTLPFETEKPHTVGAEKIVSDFGIRRRQTLVVGDSLSKDGGVAKNMGMAFAFARYGAPDFVPQQYRSWLDRLYNPEQKKPAAVVPAKKPPVHLELASYDGLLPLLRRYRSAA